VQDTETRPELCKGSVEFVAPAEYMVRPPMAPAFVFCVETTHLAVSTGTRNSASFTLNTL
jgi:protein transport protein SEC24